MTSGASRTATTGRIVVVGLGPGGHDHVTADTLAEIDRHDHRFLRTRVHPTADLVGSAVSFDDLYDSADRFDDVYDRIVERLVTAASDHHQILYAVPGSPLILERTVRLLASDGRVEVDIRPAMSFLDVAWSRLGIDPVETSVRLVDGHQFATAAAGHSGAVLIAHTHANWVLSDIKLSVDDATSSGGEIDDTPVVLLHALGTPDEQVIHTTWSEMDRTLDADHLTSVFVPSLDVTVDTGYVRFHQLARTLRERCPWDIEQTHRSLVPYLIEETYEVVDAIHGLDPDDPATDEHLIEELGDLLYQIEFHSTIAEQQGRFSIGDVTAGIHDKLVRRHPHVFGPTGDPVDTATGDPGDTTTGDPVDTTTVLATWDEIKRAEKRRTSVFDGVAASLPSLSYAYAVQKKASKVGFDWPTVDGAFPKIAEEAAELRDVIDGGPIDGPIDDARRAELDDELGDLLFSVVNVARHLRLDPEAALRLATAKFRSRFEQVEQLARSRDIDLHTADLDTLEHLWDEVKASRGH